MSTQRTRVGARASLAVASAAVVGLLAAGNARSATVTVPNNGDAGTAGAALAAAVQSAGAGDTIVLSAGSYNLRATLDLTKDITIIGPTSPPGARIDGGALTGPGSITGSYDLVAVAPGVTATLQHVALLGTGTNGTAVDVFGSLTLEEALVGPNAGLGVAAQPGSSVSVANSTISDNSSGLLAGGDSRTSLTNVTVSGNRLGGIFNSAGGQVDITNTIVAGNGSKTTRVKDCERPLGSDGAPGSATSSLDGDGSCAAPIHADPRLGRLDDNGGPTPTRLLEAGSAAIDAGGTGCPASDQRGAARIGQCDIGAFEYGATATRVKVPLAAQGGSGSGATTGGSSTGGAAGSPVAIAPVAPAGALTEPVGTRAKLAGAGTLRLHGGLARFQLRATTSARSGLVVFSDPARGLRFRITRLTSSLVDLPGRNATLRGVAVLPDGRRLGATIRIATGETGSRVDVRLSNGYSAGGPVSKGSFSITA
jgi:hypothetical protein